MPSHVVRVQKALKLWARRPTRLLLEGEHKSYFAGRSLDFDDLREYVAGDDVKDIDWMGTARSGKVLVRRYRALRHHNVVFVVDCGRNMAALSGGGQRKADLAIDLVGALGLIAQRQGDNLGLVAGDSRHYSYLPLRATPAHLEQMLQFIDGHTSLESAPSDLYAQLMFVARTIRRRLFLVVVADELALDSAHELLLRRLAAQHELLWVTVTDADPTAAGWADHRVVEVRDLSHLPPFLRDDPQLRREFAAAAAARRAHSDTVLKRLGVRHERVDSEGDVLPALGRLLARPRGGARPSPAPGAPPQAGEAHHA